MGQKVVLVDSDVLVASFYPDDSNHDLAREGLIRLHERRDRLLVINLVVQETATVISHRMGMEEARKFYYSKISVIDQILDIGADLEALAWKTFLAQTKKGTSFVDCANVAVMRDLNLDRIFSFDKFYKRVGLVVA